MDEVEYEKCEKCGCTTFKVIYIKGKGRFIVKCEQCNETYLDV